MEAKLNDTLNFNQYIACSQLRVIGIGYAIVTVVSLAANLVFIWTVLKNKKLLLSINYLITLLSIVNLVATVTQLPVMSANAIACRFLLSQYSCEALAVILNFTTIFGFYFLVLISIERFIVICRPCGLISFNAKKVLRIFMPTTAFLTTLYSLTPLLGWSIYTPDFANIYCSMKGVGSNRSFFNTILLLLLYILPLISLIFTNVATVLRVKKSRKLFENDQRKQKKEAQLVKVVVALILSFLLSFSPNTIVALIGMYNANINNGILYFTITLLISRSSLIWPAMINIFLNKNIKSLIFKKKNRKVQNLHTENKCV